jgi:hypothetical protein
MTALWASASRAVSMTIAATAGSRPDRSLPLWGLLGLMTQLFVLFAAHSYR